MDSIYIYFYNNIPIVIQTRGIIEKLLIKIIIYN